MSARKLILDGDYGIDDSLAALYLAHQPGVEIVAVGSVHGNASAATAARNALTVLDVAGLGDVPVAVGAARPLAQPVQIATRVHGSDGLGGCAPAAPPSGRRPRGVAAAVQLMEALRAHPGECTVVATGPLTNLALAVLLDPGVAPLAAGVVVMGGTVSAPGNVGPLAEANLAHDPEAAQAVLAARWPVTLVGLDVTMKTWLEGPHLERIEASRTPAGRFAWAILQHYLAYYEERHGRRGCPLHDPSAACIALDPTLASFASWAVDVELRSERNRGMLIVDRRPFVSPPPGAPPVKIATDVDAGRLVAAFVDGLLAEPAV